MNRTDDIDAMLAVWFRETAPTVVPDGLHSGVIERARSSRQHVRWGTTLRGLGSRPSTRMAWLGAAVVAAVVASQTLAGLPSNLGRFLVNETSAPSPTPVATPAPSHAVGPEPSRMTDIFSMPFVYKIPPGSGLEVVSIREKVFAWAVGPNRLPTNPNASITIGGEERDTGNTRGVMVAPVMAAWGHGPAGRVPLRSAPADFLADVDELLFGIDLGPVATTTLDGRPALTAGTAAGLNSYHSDLHLDGPITGLAGVYTVMTVPCQFIVADVDGVTVMVRIWARSEDDLSAWMPEALQLVDSIHFVPR